MPHEAMALATGVAPIDHAVVRIQDAEQDRVLRKSRVN